MTIDDTARIERFEKLMARERKPAPRQYDDEDTSDEAIVAAIQKQLREERERRFAYAEKMGWDLDAA